MNPTFQIENTVTTFKSLFVSSKINPSSGRPCSQTFVSRLRVTMTSLSFVAILILSSGHFLFAGQIVMQNGDRLTGTIIKSDDKELVIKTDYADEVTVKFSAIQQIDSDQPLHVQSKDGKTAVGAVKTVDGNLEVAAAGAPPIIVPRDSVKKILSSDEETKLEQTEHPSWRQDWDGGVNTSFALTRGNSQTSNLALAFTADRKTLHDHLGLYTTSVFAKDDAPGALPSITANSTQGGIRYDHNFGPTAFSFTGADFQTDELQSLDLRSVFSGGVGFHVVKSDRTTLDILTGVNYTRENYSAVQRDLVAANLGEELTHKIGQGTTLTQKLYAYPDFNALGEYRAVFNFGTVTKIAKRIGWQNAFSDIYVTDPPLGAKQNDILLTTGLNISFK
jgi:Putative salt-induced outer membrane protein